MTATVAIRAQAGELRRQGMAPLSALLAGVNHARDEKFIHVGDERVPWTVAEIAGGGKRSIDVEVGGSHWQNRPVVLASEAADQSDVLVELVREAPAPTKAPVLPAAGAVSISVDGAAARRFEYDLKEVRSMLPPTGDGKQTWELTLPLQGDATTAADGIALVSLVLRGNFGRSRSDRQEARLEGVAIRVQLRQVRRAASAPAVAPANSAALAPAVAPALQLPADAVTDATKAAARAELLDGLDTRNVSMCVARAGGRVLFECGSGEAESLGEATRALTAAAIVQYALSVSRGTPGNVVLNDRTLVPQLLEKSGAMHVRDAYVGAYKRAGYEPASLMQLLSDTAGLPTYAPHTPAHLHAAVADAGGIAASGDIEADFAAALELTPVLAEPGAVYNPSAVGWAVLLFALPGWERNEAVPRTMASLAGVDHRDNVVWPAGVVDAGYQGIYRLWSGMRASAGAATHMLSHPGWFHADVSGDMGWLGALLHRRVGAGHHMDAACGGWMHMRSADGYHVVAANGAHNGTLTTLVLMPAHNVSGVCIVRRSGALTPRRIVDRLARFMAAMVGARPAGAFVMLAPAECSRRAQQRAAVLLAASSANAMKIADLTDKFGGRFVAVNEPDLSITLGKSQVPPSPAEMRYTLVLERGGSERVEYVLVYDADAPANPAADADTPRGALRTVDPVTHALGEPVYFDLVSNGDRTEAFVSVFGRVFARQTVVDEARAHYDVNSAPAVLRRETEKVAAAIRLRDTEAARAERRARQRNKLRDGEQSDSDGDSDSDSDVDDSGPVAFVRADLFDALATSAPPGKRVQYGRWHQYVGTERNQAAAMLHAYPAGGRVYPVGAWVEGSVLAFYD